MTASAPTSPMPAAPSRGEPARELGPVDTSVTGRHTAHTAGGDAPSTVPHPTATDG